MVRVRGLLRRVAAGTGTTLTRDARDLLDDLLAADGPEQVAALWDAHPELHDELASRHPEIIGNLDGIPYDVRDAANRSVLEELYQDDPSDPELQALWWALDADGSSLISFDPDGSAQVTAAIWYGDLDAENVSILVPGMNSNMRDLSTWGQSAIDLNAAAGPGTATVAWFGYDSPTSRRSRPWPAPRTARPRSPAS